tara:strand:- start:54 stop:590 length:537 start_codon:yes stop_codon:yes gene_type:complete
MNKNKFFYKKYFSDYVKLTKDINFGEINSFYNLIKKLKKNNKVLIFGNGAGAAIASHVASDLTNSSRIKALSFDNSAHITCFANDYKFENWIKKTLSFHYEKGDLIILLSASGNSKNMLKAASYCNKKKINYFSITGFKKNNKLNKLSKNHYWINSKIYNHVESIQLLILLSIVDRLK